MGNLLNSLLNETDDIRTTETEDEILDPLLPEIELISRDEVQSFVRSVLFRAHPSFWTLPNTLDDCPPDERAEGGNIIHVKRAVRFAAQMGIAQEIPQEELDLLIAAALLHTLALAIDDEDGIQTFDVFYAYNVDRIIHWVREQDDKFATDVCSSTMWLEPDDISYISRLIRVQQGSWSPVPETIPLTNIEWIMHFAVLLSTHAHFLLDGMDYEEWRWEKPEEDKEE